MKRRPIAFLLACAAVGAALGLCPPLAHAGEPNAFGCMLVTDGGSVNNATTGYGSAASSNSVAFNLGTNQPVTIQCMQGPCHVAVGSATTDAGVGLYLADKEKITSSIGALPVRSPLPDAGLYVGGIVSTAQAAGATSSLVCVFQRQGNE